MQDPKKTLKHWVRDSLGVKRLERLSSETSKTKVVVAELKSWLTKDETLRWLTEMDAIDSIRVHRPQIAKQLAAIIPNHDGNTHGSQWQAFLDETLKPWWRNQQPSTNLASDAASSDGSSWPMQEVIDVADAVVRDPSESGIITSAPQPSAGPATSAKRRAADPNDAHFGAHILELIETNVAALEQRLSSLAVDHAGRSELMERLSARQEMLQTLRGLGVDEARFRTVQDDTAQMLAEAAECAQPDDPALIRSAGLTATGTPSSSWTSRPEVLIVAAPQAVSSPEHLPNAQRSAQAAQAAFGGPTGAELLLSMQFEQLDSALGGRTTFFFEGHGDAELKSEKVLAFVGADGRMESVSTSTLVETVRKHVIDDGLRLVVLMGCRTRALATALRGQACVPAVVCWDTVLLDAAAAIFSAALALSIYQGTSLQRAFDNACRAVTSRTETGRLDTGQPANVQKYELVDPLDATQVHQSGPLRGRLIALDSGARRGRMAVGRPRLLDDRASALAAVPPEAPSLGERHVRRDALTRRLITAMTSGEATVVCSLKGEGGVGKSTLASALVNDDAVRCHYANGGILWINASVEGGGDAVASIVSTVASRMHSWLLSPRFGSRELPPSGDSSVGWIAAQVREHGLRVLAVLDNATRPELVAALRGCGLRLLVTTRERHVAEAGASTPIEVGFVDEPTARRMLARYAGLETLPAEAEGVLTVCAGLALTLAVVGATFAQEESLSWVRLLEEWREMLEADLPTGTGDELLDASRYASLQHAIVKVSMRRLPGGPKGPLATAYRSLAIAPKRLPLELELLRVILGAPDDATALEWRRTLESYSLLQLAQDGGTCTVHDLQLDCLRLERLPAGVVNRLVAWMVSPSTLDMLAASTGGSLGQRQLGIMALWREVEREDADVEAGRAYTSARALVPSTAEQADPSDSERYMARVIGAAHVLEYMDRLDAAMTLHDHAEMASERAVAHDADTALHDEPEELRAARQMELRAVGATTRAAKATVLQRKGKPKEAEAVYVKELETYSTTVGRHSLAVAATLGNLANVLADQGKLDQVCIRL